MKQTVTRRLLLLASCCLLVAHAGACVITYVLVDVNPSFHVTVKHEQRPVSGIAVAVYRTRGADRELEDKPFLQFVSDENGIIHVSLKPGTYLIATEGPGQGSAVYAVVGDKKRNKRKDEVSLEWPARTTIRTRSLAGKLLDASHWSSSFEMSLANAELELWKPGNLSPVARQTSSWDGRFKFQIDEPGPYIVRVKGGSHEGEIGLDLLPASSDAVDEVKLHLTETSCGLGYQQCPAREPLELQSSNLKFLDSTGKPWRGASYRLEDSRGKLIAEGITDESGRSALGDGITGEFKIVLAKPFDSVEQIVRFNRHEHSSGTALIVQFDGVCSHLSLEKNATPQ